MTIETMPEAGPSKSIRVLLVDDQRLVGEAVRRMLMELPGAEFRFCAVPAQAIEQAAQFQPTVILQDLIMPDVDGLEMVRRFRANPGTATVPLVVLSSKEEAKTKAEAFAAGANDYLVKLPDKLELLARVAYHSDAYSLRQERDAAFEAIHVQKERMAEDLAAAKNYVRSLLPQPLEPTESLAVDWRFVPSPSRGGDCFGYAWIDDGKLAMYLLDVSGAGVGAPLLSVSAVNAIRSGALPETDFAEPAQVLQALNAAFPMARHGERTFSIWYGIYDVASRTLTYASGGHPPALLVAVDGAPKQLASTGMIVGLFPSARYTQETVAVESGTVLYVYSDGCCAGQETAAVTGRLETCALSMEGLDDTVRALQEMQGVPEPADDMSLMEFRFF